MGSLECKWILGGPGTGKTARAVTVVCDALEKGLSPEKVLFLTFNPGTRDLLEHAIRARYRGWSGRLLYNTRMLLDIAQQMIPPWERLSLLSEYQQFLSLQDDLESKMPFDEGESRLSPTSLATKLYPLIRQLKRGGVNLGLLKHRLASSKASTKLIEFIQTHIQQMASQRYGDFIDQMAQVLRFAGTDSGKKNISRFDLIVADDLHLAHRMQWRLLEMFLADAKEIHFYSEPDGPFFRQWADRGYQNRLRELGINISRESLQEKYRIGLSEDSKPLPKGISIQCARNAWEEGLWIAEQVDRMVSEAKRDVRFSDIAVIYPSESWARALRAAFHLYRIPNQMDQAVRSKDTQTIAKWFQWLDKPTHSDFLRLLSPGYSGFSIERDKAEELYSSIGSSESQEADRDISLDERMKELGGRVKDLLQSWRERKYEIVLRSLLELMKSMIDNPEQADVQTLEEFDGLFSEYRTWCGIIGKRFQIGEFLDSLGALPNWNRTYPRPSRLGDQVKLWSIPDSRGREARFVFLAGANDGVLPLPYRRKSLIPEEDKHAWRRALAELGTPADLSELDSDDDHWTRERERFDLAVSRAKEKLIVTYVRTRDNEELLEPSPFLSLGVLTSVEQRQEKTEGMFPSLALPTSNGESVYIPYFPSIRGIGYLLDSLAHDGKNRDELYYAWDQLWGKSSLSKSAFIPQFLERQRFQLPRDFALSHSRLKSYLDCPRKFYYENILKIETPSTYQMQIGTALHRLAQKIHAEGGSRVFSDMDILRQMAEKCLDGHPELFQGRLEKDGWVEYILDRIGDYLQWVEANHRETFGVEVDFDHRWDEEIRFRGRIDRLGRDTENELVIIDYKKSGDKKAGALINQFRERDDDFQFPIYYFAIKEQFGMEPTAFQQMVFDFNKLRELQVITIPVSQTSNKTSVTFDELKQVRTKIVDKAKEILAVREDFRKGSETECRGFFSTCPYLPFCTKSGDVVDD